MTLNAAALAQAGVNVDDALARVMGNEQLLARLLSLYAADDKPARIIGALDDGDVEAAREEAHALKGTAGNLSIEPVFALATRINDLLRAGDAAGARTLADELACAHRAVCAAIAQES